MKNLKNILITIAVGLYFFFPYSVRLGGLRLPFFLPFLVAALLILATKRLWHMRLWPIVTLFGLFLAAVGVSTLTTSQSSIDALWRIEPLLVVAGFFVVAFSWEPSKTWLLRASGSFVLASSALAFLQFWTPGYRFYPAIYFWGQPNIHYAFGFASYASLFGLEMIILLPLALVWALEAPKLWERRIAEIAFVLGSGAAFLSFSLASWLGWLFAMVVIFALAKPFRRSILRLCLFIALAIFLILAIPPLNQTWSGESPSGEALYRTTPDFAYRNVIPQDGAVRTRLATLQAGLAMFKERPLFGWGANGFREVYGRFRPNLENIDPRANINAHNTYLETLVSGGIIGFISFLTLIFVAIKKLLKEYLITKYIFPLALLASFVGLGIHAIFHTVLYDKFLWILLGFIYGRKLDTADS